MTDSGLKEALKPLLALGDSPMRGLLILVGGLTLLVFCFTPIYALTWNLLPFPGFVVEQTLVVADSNGSGWSGRQAGMTHPERVLYIGNHPVGSPAEMQTALAGYQVGQEVGVVTVTPGGALRTYAHLKLIKFPSADLVRLFWLPTLVGLAYLVMGWWVLRVRGKSPAGRAFAYFCFMAAIASGLLFDLITTHVGSFLWTIAVAQLGGALISLAMLFPNVWRPVESRPWLRFLPYLISIGLAVWGLVELRDPQSPWAYITSWRYNYYYTSLGILFFLGMMIWRNFTIQGKVARQQVRIILLGALLSFLPLAVWFISPIFAIPVRWIPELLLPFLLIFPICISLAILRYRLWDVDVLINRALVYGALSIILATIYLASVVIFQSLFALIIRNNSRLEAVLSTLVIVALFNPIRTRLQSTIDRRFYRRKYDAARTIADFTEEVRNDVDLDEMVKHLLDVLDETLEPARSALWVVENSE